MDFGEGSVLQTSDSGFIILSTTDTIESSGTTDVSLIRIDTDGDMLWTKTWAGTGNEKGRMIQQTSDGGYIVLAASNNITWLLKTNSDGDTTWTKTFDLGDDGEGSVVRQTADGGYAIFGQMFGTLDSPAPGEGDRDWLLIKTDNLGNLEWSQTYGGDFQDQSTDMILIDGGYLLTGWLEITDSGNSTDLWLVKTDTLGDTVWTSAVGGTGFDVGFGLVELAEGEYAVVGVTDSWGAVGWDGWLVRFGTGVISVDEKLSEIPEQYALKQNFPNPFNPETVIEYSLSKDEEVSFVVYNLIGEEVAQLINERKPAGNYTVVWDASGMASGIYFYRLQAGDFVQTRKMVLLK